MALGQNVHAGADFFLAQADSWGWIRNIFCERDLIRKGFFVWKFLMNCVVQLWNSDVLAQHWERMAPHYTRCSLPLSYTICGEKKLVAAPLETTITTFYYEQLTKEVLCMFLIVIIGLKLTLSMFPKHGSLQHIVQIDSTFSPFALLLYWAPPTAARKLKSRLYTFGSKVDVNFFGRAHLSASWAPVLTLVWKAYEFLC